MYASYSPLFTQGLLAEHSPLTTPARSPDDVSAFYFTLQHGKRDSLELRSFLYLDLADRNPRAPAHRRKCSVLSKSTSWTCTADAKSVHDLPRTAKPVLMTPLSPAPSARRRTSKESLRTLPSPKPAPLTTLPDLPVVPTVRAPRSPAPSRSPSKKRPVSTIVSSLLSPTPRVRRPASLRSESISSYDRRKSRMDALARLEGRVRAPRATSLRNNFMSFSDDEDDKPSRTPTMPTHLVVQVEDLSAFADVEDEADAIIPSPIRRRGLADVAKRARHAKAGRKRRSTLESWFPLKSFMDLKDDDLSSWNWRSFIEIGGVS